MLLTVAFRISAAVGCLFGLGGLLAFTAGAVLLPFVDDPFGAVFPFIAGGLLSMVCGLVWLWVAAVCDDLR